MWTNVEKSVRVQESPEQGYKGFGSTSVSSLENTEAIYLLALLISRALALLCPSLSVEVVTNFSWK